MHCGPPAPRTRIDVGIDADRTGGADHPALTAANAVRFSDGLIKSRGDQRIGAAVGKVDGIDPLNIGAHSHAVSAENALVGVADDRRRAEVYRLLLLCVFKTDCGNAQSVCQILQVTFPALDAGGAVPVMSRQQQLQNQLPVFHKPGGVGVDHHAVLGTLGAGGKGLSGVGFHGAEPTGTINGKLGVVAERGNVDPCLTDHGEYIRLVGKLDPPIINHHISHCNSLLIRHKLPRRDRHSGRHRI